jgi:hypothetical protein
MATQKETVAPTQERDTIKSELLECVDDCAADPECQGNCYLNDCKQFCKGDTEGAPACQAKCDKIPFGEKTSN